MHPKWIKVAYEDHVSFSLFLSLSLFLCLYSLFIFISQYVLVHVYILHISLHMCFFPECVAKRSRFTFGCLGVETCSRDPASGVRNRLRTAIVAEKLPCPWGKPQKRVFLDVPEDVVMSFCVASVALCDIRCVSGGMCGHDRRWTKVAVSMEKATKTCLPRRVRRCGHVVLRVSGGMCVHDGRWTKVAVSMEEATKTCSSRRVRRCAHVGLRGRRGTLWHSMCFRRNGCARP